MFIYVDKVGSRESADLCISVEMKEGRKEIRAEYMYHTLNED